MLGRLRTARVVTLTGPGGCGKTRLALRVAALAEAGFGDGARLVELAPLTDPALVAASVARALGVSERDAPTPAAGLARELAGRELLVVLDNCEHVLAAAARLVAALAARCRRVRFLATSRERLDVPGELVVPVPPLGLPADGSAAAVAASEAGALFAARAGAASPGFALSARNSAAVAQVCARLDGIPLAIELAAARCPALGPAELAARLDGHPGLLAMAAYLSGDLAEQARHGRLAVELARAAAGQEGLALALTAWSLSAIAGAGIQPATVAALEEAATLTAAHPDRFTETAMRQLRAELFAILGQLDAAETEVGLCWAAGRSGAVRLVEFRGPLAEARLAAARGDTAAAIGALRRAADGGRRVAIVAFVPAALAGLACLAAIAGDQSTAAAAVGEARTALGGRRQAITLAALRYAEGVMAWHRGELADAEHLAARPPCSGTAAVTGWPPATASNCSACSPPPGSASPMRRACSPPPKRPGGRCGTWPPGSPPTARPPPAPPARPGRPSATTGSPRPGTKARHLPSTMR